MLFRVLVLLLVGDPQTSIPDVENNLVIYEGATTFRTLEECEDRRREVGAAILKTAEAPSGLVLFRCTDKDVPTFMYDEYGIDDVTRDKEFPAERLAPKPI